MSEPQTALEKMRAFVALYPDFDILGGFTVDYTDKVPDCAGLFPGGLVETRRRADILGEHVEVDNQLNFALYTRLAKDATDDEGAAANAEWQIGFQEWVQAMSATGQAPAFGDYPRSERIAAQNGAVYSADEEGTALYAIQLSVNYTKRY